MEKRSTTRRYSTVLTSNRERANRLVKTEHRLGKTLVLALQVRSEASHRTAPTVESVFYTVSSKEEMGTGSTVADTPDRYEGVYTAR